MKSVQIPTHSRKPLSVSARPLLKRLAVLAAAIGFPAMAASDGLGPWSADPSDMTSQGGELSYGPLAMPFERPGMSFPGSAFYYLADPPAAGLIALPDTDPYRNRPTETELFGSVIDAGAPARPFVLRGSISDRVRAQECLAQAIWYEAASESEAGQRAVAQVVLNRVAHPSWPSSVCGVVFQGSDRTTGCQFTFTCDGSLARPAVGESWRRARWIASQALDGTVYRPVGHSTHYHALWVAPNWARSLENAGTIGAHRFYRLRGRSGAPEAFSLRHSGIEPLVSAPRISLSRAGSAPSSGHRAAASTITDPSAPGLKPGAQVNDIRPEAVVSVPLPTSAIGQVRSEYARAGQWKDRAGNGPAKPSPEASSSSARDLENQ